MHSVQVYPPVPTEEPVQATSTAGAKGGQTAGRKDDFDRGILMCFWLVYKLLNVK
jgi:hypothetical protein